MIANRWKPSEAENHTTRLAQRVYSSRLLGQDAELVLHGGGNTSVKDEALNLFGESEPVLYIKGSGWDLATIEEPGFPAVKMAPLLRLRQLEQLGDVQMMNALRTCLVDSRSPDPSVEALLHAFLPHRFIDHTHADAILTLTNQPKPEKRLMEIYGDRVAVIPYVMPGFQLARACAETFEKNPSVEGMILLRHGIFTFGETAKESYERMIRLVQQAEEVILSETGGFAPAFGIKSQDGVAWWMQSLRREYLKRGFPAILKLNGSQEALYFANHPDAHETSQRGPLTPDHIIRTKRNPLFLESGLVQERSSSDISKRFDRYEKQYREYFSRHGEGTSLQCLDPLPRVCLLPGIGIVTAGKTAKDARICMDIYSHTADVILKAEQMDGYESLSESDLFEMEYWVLEQAKLKLSPKTLPLSGKIAAISGGASGIGLAIAKEFLQQGAVVHILDIEKNRLDSLDAVLAPHKRGGDAHTYHVDVGNRGQVAHAVKGIVQTSGGIDILVVNAGIFGPSASIEDIAESDWDKSLSVNLNGAFHFVAEALRWLKMQENGGDIIFIASRNVPAPGPKAAAYSVTKAAQTQLARVCALETAGNGIRVNSLHPHNVLDTALRSEEVIEERAKAYGMSKEEYKRSNLLRTTVSAQDVARAAFSLVSGCFSKTTGAQIPIDGGSERTL